MGKEIKPRGVKKGQSPSWKVGRKKVEKKVRYISKSVSLPAEKWDRLEKIAEQQGLTKNKLIANLIDNFLNILEKK